MPRTSPLCNYFVFFKYITNSRCLSTLFSALCCFGAQFTILSFSPPALLGAKHRTMSPPAPCVPYSLIGRGTLCSRQPITPTTLWGLNFPALQTLFSARPSHQKTAGANRPGCPFLLISKAIPHNSRLTAQAPLRWLRHGICVAKMLDNVGLQYPHRTSGTKAPRTLRPLPLLALTFAASSIICAFGLAAAAPRSPYRHLELCGIALTSTFTAQCGNLHCGLPRQKHGKALPHRCPSCQCRQRRALRPAPSHWCGRSRAAP